MGILTTALFIARYYNNDTRNTTRPRRQATLLRNTATAVLNIWAAFKSVALPLFDLRPTTLRLLSYTGRT
jgi:hypothetical protein